jgi:hypothetical protein
MSNRKHEPIGHTAKLHNVMFILSGLLVIAALIAAVVNRAHGHGQPDLRTNSARVEANRF